MKWAKFGCLLDVLGFVLVAIGFVYVGLGEYDSKGMLLVYGILAFILGIIFNVLGLVGAAAGAAIDLTEKLIKCVVNGIIDLFSIKEEIRIKVPSALKAQILVKKKNAIDVGIFCNNTSSITTKMTIQSDDGVSNDIYEGQIIYI